MHRDPYAVFASTRKMLIVTFSMHCLQSSPAAEELDEWIIQQYRAMHDAFFKDRDLIRRDIITSCVSRSWRLIPSARCSASMRRWPFPSSPSATGFGAYVDSVRGYQKNTFPELPVALRRRIADAWRPSFEQWGYSSDPALGQHGGAADPRGPRLSSDRITSVRSARVNNTVSPINRVTNQS